MHSLMSVLELHARLLRANMWQCDDKVFDAWVSERRTDATDPDSDLYNIILSDMKMIVNVNPRLSNAVTQLIPLLIEKKMAHDLILGYHRRDVQREDAYAFIIKQVFTQGCTPDLEEYSARKLEEYTRRTENNKRNAVSYLVRPVVKRLKLTSKHEDDNSSGYDETRLAAVSREASTRSESRSSLLSREFELSAPNRNADEAACMRRIEQLFSNTLARRSPAPDVGSTETISSNVELGGSDDSYAPDKEFNDTLDTVIVTKMQESPRVVASDPEEASTSDWNSENFSDPLGAMDM